jgi:hypothetical protein
MKARARRTFDAHGRLLGDDADLPTVMQDTPGDTLDTVTVTATPLPPLPNPLLLIGALLLLWLFYGEREHG